MSLVLLFVKVNFKKLLSNSNCNKIKELKMPGNVFISIISPVYKAENILDELVKTITNEVSKITDNFEIILVEDHSPDNSWVKIVANCSTYPFVKGIKLSRNFGQHNAIAAGMQYVLGDYIIVMDCDLQDNPIYIPQLIAKANEGFDIVYTVKKERKHSILKNITASVFHKVFAYLVGGEQIKTDGRIGSFSLINRKVVNAYNSLNDDYRPYLVMLNLLGFNASYVNIEHEERYSGTSSYTFIKLARHALNGIISQTDRLLKLAIYLSIIYMVLSFIFGLYIFIQSIFHGFQSGWASIAFLISFNTGVILFFLGIIGLYISRIFLQVKKRPLFIIDKKINL
ncbi:MAG: glycosyltransferase family 2 protein [Bacteroidota bacterium]